MDSRSIFTQFSYLAASALFVLGLRSLSAAPDRARRGMNLAALGMLLAVIGTLVQHEIVRYEWIVVGIVAGSATGAAMAIFMPMTAMPQRIAISHMFGALAATLVGVGDYLRATPEPRSFHIAALGFEVLFGSLTITGSFLAFCKLQGLVPSPPINYGFQNQVNLTILATMVGLYAALVAVATPPAAFFAIIALGLLVGVLMVLPIGGADMPVLISLLNSYAGLAASATGFAIGNNVLILCGALDGASGLLLSILMSRAMNRSFASVLFGAFGGAVQSGAATAAGLTVHPISAEEAALQLAYAHEVIVVPGYGMAVAQAQQQVRELAELIEQRGGTVKYAIHPVAGRMPGHMNVLLAEAHVPYDQLYDLDQINDEFKNADVALVVGANDVVNPAAKHDPSSPIYGMPILNVDSAGRVIVLKRSMGPGFAGIENELFYEPKTSMLFGDAKTSLKQLAADVKAA